MGASVEFWGQKICTLKNSPLFIYLFIWTQEADSLF